MIVTESKLTELMGYTKSEIKGRRQSHWIEGVHFAYDPARKIVYNVGEIERWAFPVLEMCVEDVKSDGMKTANSAPNYSTIPLPHQANRKPQKYV